LKLICTVAFFLHGYLYKSNVYKIVMNDGSERLARS